MKRMIKLALEGRVHPLVLKATAEALKDVPPRDDWAAVQAIFEWVRKNIRYTKDPVSTNKLNNVELVHHPAALLRLKIGDCDDMATLLASMLLRAGIPAKFRAIKTGGKHFRHVYVLAKVNNTWIPLDPTTDKPLGWEYPYACLLYTSPSPRDRG